MAEIVRTNLMAMLKPQLSRIHDRRRIGVYAGPPGIGKTTAVRQFAEDHQGAVVIATVPAGPKTGIRSTAALQSVLDGLYALSPSLRRVSYPTNYLELRARTYNVVGEWCGFDKYSRLTVVLDEAQNLSAEAIETLIYLNDDDVGFSPFPIGLVFVGNNTFRLQSDRNGHSVLTDAVRDRALYAEVLSHADVTDDDFGLFMDAQGITDPEAHQIILRLFRSGRRDRSFRRLQDLLDELQDEAGGAPVTADIVKTTLGLA